MTRFQESQKFRQMWVLIPLIGMSCLFLWGSIQQLILGVNWGSKPAPDGVLIIGALISVALVVLFFAMRLDTEITERAIKIRFYPFLTREFLLEDIKEVHIRQYAPIREYGGWGIRWGREGVAYSVSGKTGLQVVLKNKKKILIGTQKPKELQQALEQLEF